MAAFEMKMARPRGSGQHQRTDAALADLMQQLLQGGDATSPTRAAGLVAHMARGNSRAAIIDRLVRCHRRRYPKIPINPGRRGGAESDSTAAMTIPATVTAQEHQRVVADLAAERAANAKLRGRLNIAHRAMDRATAALNHVLPDVVHRLEALELQDDADDRPAVH